LGKVKEYVIHYELQHHGFIHVHIILWVQEEDLMKITNEIVVVILVTIDETIAKFVVPNDSLQNKLFKMVLRKQLHECQSQSIRKNRNGTSRFGFPFASHVEPNSFFNKETNKWEYYKPRYEDQNVVSYHPTLLLLWGVHFNVLHITSSYWSFYLLKYAMKCEPPGTLNLNYKNGERLGLQNESKLQLQLISSFIISKPMSLAEGTLICLNIPIIHKS
jgi:hypothetical protein